MKLVTRTLVLAALLMAAVYLAQGLETARLGRVHAATLADLRARGALGAANPAAEQVAGAEARAWFTELRRIADDLLGASVPKGTSWWAQVEALSAAPGPWLEEAALPGPALDELDALLAREPPPDVARVRTGPASATLRFATGPGAIVTVSPWGAPSTAPAVPAPGTAGGRPTGRTAAALRTALAARSSVLRRPLDWLRAPQALLLLAAHRDVRDGDVEHASARLAAVLELLAALDDGSRDAGTTRLALEMQWLAYLEALRAMPAADPQVLQRVLDPVLARASDPERARRAAVLTTEGELGPGHAPWTEPPPDAAVFARGARLAHAVDWLAGLDAVLERLASDPAAVPAAAVPARAAPLVPRATDDLNAMRALALARVGLALDAHRAAHGAWPAGLAELQPLLVGGVPPDPLTGAPFALDRSGTAPLLVAPAVAGGPYPEQAWSAERVEPWGSAAEGGR